IGDKYFATAADPKAALKTFKLPKGYQINLFASEKDFPELAKPVAVKFDGKGRLWVATSPTYPQYFPGVKPNDKILILEDTDGDGKADKCTVWADHLYLPIAFELGDGGAYVSAQPNLLFIKDEKGKSGKRTTLLRGFGTGDSHHAINAFSWGPE